MRGTTPTHRYTLPFDESMVRNLRIIYTQGGEKKFVKTLNDCTWEGNTVVVKLTQENTLSFDEMNLVEIQIRALTHEGDAPKSRVIQVNPGRCLEDEVMV